MKKSKLIVILLLFVCLITACGKDAKTFVVTFDSDGGSSVGSVEVSQNETVTKPQNPSKIGYTFLGWYLNNVEYDFSSKVTDNITLTAKWSIDNTQEKVWTVTFDSNGGSAIDPLEVNDGAKVKSTTPSKDGYTFLGWYVGEEKFDFNTPITKSITLVAKWEKAEETTKYTIKFDSQGGSTVKNQSVAENGTAKKPTAPTRKGYIFKGWYLGDTEYNFNTKVTKNITLTAKWEKEAPKYSYTWEKITESTTNEYYLFLTKDGVKIAGTAVLTSQGGKEATVTIPVTGLKIVKDHVAKVDNIKEN